MDWRDSLTNKSEIWLINSFLEALSDDGVHFSIQLILNTRIQSPARFEHGQLHTGRFLL